MTKNSYTVFDVVKNKLPGMLETINKMIEEL